MYGKVYGEYGRSLLDSPTETVRISIVKTAGNEALWDATWNGRERLTVLIFDYGPGIEFHGLKKDERERKHIRTITYDYDPKADEFVEEIAK